MGSHNNFPPDLSDHKQAVSGESGSANVEQDKVEDYYEPKSHDQVMSATASPAMARRRGICHRISSAVNWGLESAFFRLGLVVGRHPIPFIIVPIAVCGICGIAMQTFHREFDTSSQEKMWTPTGSRGLIEKQMADSAFPKKTRFVSVLVVQESNVLTPTVMNALMDIHDDSMKIEAGDSKFPDLCVRLGPHCYVSSLLELWYYDKIVISTLTTSDIQQEINNKTNMPLSGVAVKTLLGGDITYDGNGGIIGATATEITWVTKKDDKQSGESNAEIFEKEMIALALKGHEDIDDTYVLASRSWQEEYNKTNNSDARLLAAGFLIVFVFVALSLGKFNLLEQKIYLSMSGLLCVGLAVVASFGVGTTLGVLNTVVMNLLPFLLLGVGVDDMFVLLGNWKNLTPEEEALSTPYKLATALGRAGVSITVTSVTDMAAFSISSGTAIPAMSAFCIYATIGIFALFILVTTLFAGVLALDEQRRRQRRDACILCYVHEDNYVPNSCSQGQSLMQTFFSKYYGPLLTKKVVKVIVILFTVVCASIGFWRFSMMRIQEANLLDYVPQDSYVNRYAATKKKMFEKEGEDSTVFCGGFGYFKYTPNIDDMYTKLSNSKYIQNGTIVAWFTAFKQEYKGQFTGEPDYNSALFKWVNSGAGRRFSSSVKFNSSKEPVSIVATRFTMRQVLQPDSESNFELMDNIREIIDSSGFPAFFGDDMPRSMCFAFSPSFMSYETNRILEAELYRNITLAAIAVLVITIVLIANVWTSFMVLICVLFTVIDLGGVLELWGTTINVGSSILFTVSIGLAIDFSAHVGHTFMTVQGSGDERAVLTLTNIGPAVFNGGFSTILAFILLANSEGFAMVLFFRVFLLVVLFGLFHGLVFLPVLLSLLGPTAYSYDKPATSSGNAEGRDDESKCPCDIVDQGNEPKRPSPSYTIEQMFSENRLATRIGEESSL